MKLQDLAETKASKQISKVYESYFGKKIDMAAFTPRMASQMLSRVRSLIKEHRSTISRHTSEQSPAYLKLVMMEQALSARIKEMAPAAPAAPGAPARPAAPSSGSVTTAPKVDPKLKAAQDKVKRGQTLTPDEQTTLNNAAAQMQENRLRRAWRMLKESEVQQAQVVLAAQDMVDKMQSMLEDVSEMQFKELPALVDSIKNQVGMDQAQQFNTDATAALTGLLQNIQGAKQQLETALGVVTGQESPMANIGDISAGQEPADFAAGQADLDAAAADAGGDAEAELDDIANPDQALGTQGSLGRARR